MTPKKKKPSTGGEPATKSTAFTHIDDFISKLTFDKAENHARFFFHLKRLSAHDGMVWAPWIQQYKLFCTFEGKRWRVTGASRTGDVHLHSDLGYEGVSYEKRGVAVDDCTEWSTTE